MSDTEKKTCRRGRRRRGRGILAVLLIGGLAFAAGKASGGDCPKDTTAAEAR